MNKSTTPKDFQRELCAMIVKRLDTQNIRGKQRDKIALEILCGASSALFLTKSKYYSGVALIAMLTSVRGMESVNLAANGQPVGIKMESHHAN